VGSSASVQVVSGTSIGPYVVERKLAHGGMSVLFLAHDTQLDRPVALKMLAEEVATHATRARMLREARTLAAVDHPGIVRIYGAGEHEGKPWIAMELVRGTDLKRLLAERGVVTPARALRWVLQATDALAAAHDVGVVHRDLKPSNLLLTHDDRVKVVDFGVAKRRVEAQGSGDVLTSQGEVLGTPAYLSPEQLEHGLADERSDVWGLGCVLYELCVGAPPFGRTNSAATTAAILRDEPPYPHNLTGAVMEVMQACLRKNSFGRVASMRELGALVRDALDQSHPPSTPAGSGVGERQSSTERSARGSSVRPSAPPARGSEAPPRPSETARPPAPPMDRDRMDRTSRSPSIAARATVSSRVPRPSTLSPPALPSERPSLRPESAAPYLSDRPSAREGAAREGGAREGASGAVRVARGRMKGTAIRTGLLWFAQRYGTDSVARLWDNSSPELRSIVRLDDPSFGIVASGWYDTRLVGELLGLLEEAAATDDGDAWASDLAEAIAKDNVGGVYRSLFRLITTPAMLEANAQRVWRTYCDEGILIAHAPRAGEVQLEVRYWTHHHAYACRVVGYAIQHVLRAVGYEALVIERTACVSQGDASCAFEGIYLPK
jgi:serine/threonine protein kinase